MRKVVIHRPGGYQRLTLHQVPDTAPGPGEVLVATTAVGVNYADCVVRMGLYASAQKYVGWPITPGFEFCGRVRAVGQGVDDLVPGARVFGVTRFGGYASEVCVPRTQLFAPPARLSDVQLAALPTVALTAWYALDELAAVRAGQTVLVHSAAGGVGGALVQLGRIAGCRVVGVVGGGHKVQTARDHGADVVIDKQREDLWACARRAAPDGYDAVFDANGYETLRKSYSSLAPTGRLVIYGFHTMLPRGGGRPSWPRLVYGWLRTPRFNPLDMTGDNKSVMAFNLSYLFDNQSALQRGMSALLGHVERGDFAPPPVRTFPFDQVAEAHRALERGDTVGKLVLTL